MVFKKGNLFGKYKRTDETKRKISENKDRSKKISLALKGRIFSDEWKEKLKENHWSKNGDTSWNKGIRQWENKEHPKGMLGKHHTEETKEKLSELNKGKKNYFYGKHHSKETIEKIRKKLIGKMVLEKNPRWLGGKSFEPYTKEFNKQFKQLILERDGFLCPKCGMRNEDSLILFKRKLHIHHINYDKKLTIPQNCCALCVRCNSEVNINRKQWTTFFQSILSEKYNYEYSINNLPIINL